MFAQWAGSGCASTAPNSTSGSSTPTGAKTALHLLTFQSSEPYTAALLGKLPEAEQALHDALLIDPSLSRAYLALVNLYVREKRFGEFAKAFRNVGRWND